jgi:recombination protein RecT
MSETNKQLAPIDDLKKQIQTMKPQIQAALPKHVDAEKFSRVVMTALSGNADLVKATRQSFFSACLKLASDGLLPDSREAAIVTFKRKDGTIEATPMPMIAGILKKVRQSGEIKTMTSNIVYEGDEFIYFVDHDGEHVKHVPKLFGERGKAIGAYALAKTKDDAIYVEVMDVNQIMAVKASSRSAQYGPWSGSFETEMWRKTVMRRLSKRLPMSTDLEETLRRDDDLYEFEKPAETTDKPVQIAAPKEKNKPSKLKEILKDVTPEQLETSPNEPVSSLNESTTDEI